jgi:hypothetical protein
MVWGAMGAMVSNGQVPQRSDGCNAGVRRRVESLARGMEKGLGMANGVWCLAWCTEKGVVIIR